MNKIKKLKKDLKLEQRNDEIFYNGSKHDLIELIKETDIRQDLKEKQEKKIEKKQNFLDSFLSAFG